MKIWFIALFLLCLVLIFSTNARDNFTGMSSPSGPLDKIDVTQPAKKVLKDIVAKDPNRYNSFFNNLGARSSRNDAKYPLMWPLTAGDINNRLAFAPTATTNGWTTKNLMVTENPLTDEYIWFTGDTDQIRVFSPSNPSNPDNYLSGWSSPLQIGMCGPAGGAPDAYAGPRYGPSCYDGCDTLTSELSSPFSITTQPSRNICSGNIYSQKSPAISHCHDTNYTYLRNGFDQKVYGYAHREYPYIDPASVGCKFKTDQEAYACCTSFSADAKTTKETCWSAFMPSASTTTSVCQPFMLGICEENWDAPACQSYLDSWKDNSDVGEVVKMTVANYINSMSTRYPCTYSDGKPGTNDYTTPLLGKVCTLSGGGVRDDSKDNFIGDTLIKLCSETAEGGVCDDILQEYCAQFTREDLISDSSEILQKICGCHLAVANQQPVQKCQGPNAPRSCLKNINPKIQPNQYVYPGTPLQCDPVCVQPGTVQHQGPACTQTVCIMENVNANLINSACKGGVTIAQICGNDKVGDGTGNCYMNNVEVNLINSTCGGVFLDQQCNACFTFPPDRPWETTLVPCCDPSNTNGGQCSDDQGGGGGIGSGKGSSGGGANTNANAWSKKSIVIVGVVALILIVLLGGVVYFSTKTSEPDNEIADASVFDEPLRF